MKRRKKDRRGWVRVRMTPGRGCGDACKKKEEGRGARDDGGAAGRSSDGQKENGADMRMDSRRARALGSRTKQSELKQSRLSSAMCVVHSRVGPRASGGGAVFVCATAWSGENLFRRVELNNNAGDVIDHRSLPLRAGWLVPGMDVLCRRRRSFGPHRR